MGTLSNITWDNYQAYYNIIQLFKPRAKNIDPGSKNWNIIGISPELYLDNAGIVMEEQWDIPFGLRVCFLGLWNGTIQFDKTYQIQNYAFPWLCSIPKKGILSTMSHEKKKEELSPFHPQDPCMVYMLTFGVFVDGKCYHIWHTWILWVMKYQLVDRYSRQLWVVIVFNKPSRQITPYQPILTKQLLMTPYNLTQGGNNSSGPGWGDHIVEDPISIRWKSKCMSQGTTHVGPF